MATLGELVERHEEAVFVGRDDAIEEFSHWIEVAEPSDVLFNVTGHGGVGKTALLRAFARTARRAGRSIRFVDGRDLTVEPASLHRALDGEDADTTVATLNGERPVLLLDTFDIVPAVLHALVDDILPRLDSSVRIVVASREPLFLRRDHPLAAYVREIRLRTFTREEIGAYLDKRGITEPGAVPDVFALTRGNPLALSLVADLVRELGVSDLRAGGSWKETVRRLTERLLRGVDADRRLLLEAASVMRQFDRRALAAVVDGEVDDFDEAFVELTRLLLLRPAEHGLRLHEDVRQILADDLRNRAPDRFHELRLRALEHYRQRLATAERGEREWLVNERLYLWEHDFIRTTLFPDEHVGDDVFLEPARAEDAPVLRDLWRRGARRITAAQGGAASDDLSDDEIDRLLTHEHVRFMLARDTAGEVLAAGVEIPVAQETRAVLPAVLRPLVEHHFQTTDLPVHATSTPYRYLGPIFGVEQRGEVAAAKLARWAIGSWIHGGTIFVATTMSGYAGLMEMLGFARVPLEARLEDRPIHGLVLDLDPDDVETWMQRMIGMAAVPAAGAAPGATAASGSVRRYAVRLLGDFAVTSDGEDVTPVGLPATAVKHVALAGGSLHADQVAELLWPEAAPGVGRGRLRGALRRLRAATGSVLVREGPSITFGSADIDVLAFTEDVNAATAHAADPARARDLAERAIARYRGDLLPGDPYEDAFVGPRERLRRLLLVAHDVVVAAATASGDTAGALGHLERTIELDPYDEDRYLRIAEVLAAEDRVGQALRMLRQARKRCHELGVPTSRRFEELERSLLR